MSEWRLWEGDEPPIYSTPEWYAERERAPHLEQYGGQRDRLILAAEWINAVQPESVVDLGAGDGGLLSILDPGIKRWGYDLQPSNIEGAKERGVDVRLGDFLNDPVDWAELAICTETIEHLVDPHAFVRQVQSQMLLASSPALETNENHYEFHLWAWDVAGYKALLERGGYKVVKHRTISGFQVILGVRP